MIGRAKRFLQTLRAVAADFEEAVGEFGRLFVVVPNFVLHPFQPFRGALR